MKKIIFLLLLIVSPCFIYSQEKTEETTVITIKNARQTTYEKNKKSSKENDEQKEENKDEEKDEDSQDTIVLEGNVEISVAKGSTVSEIKADKITYDRKTEMLYAQGNVEILTKSSSEGGETTTATSLPAETMQPKLVS